MSVQLVSIAFNLFPGGLDQPSVTIRKNASEPVRLPEWRAGETFTAEQCAIAYSNSDCLNRNVNIRVQVQGRAGTSATIRAQGPPTEELGCSALFGNWVRSFLRWSQHMLGEVEPFVVTFPESQRVDQLSIAEVTVPLSRFMMGRLGVSINNTSWDWKYLDQSGAWRDIITTRHRVYCLANHPKRPWEEDYMDGANPRLPWTDALDVACEWATGMRNVYAAAGAIVRGLWNSRLRYDPGALAPVLPGTFNLTELLAHLRGGTGVRLVECHYCAAAVSTLANLLGADLDQLIFSNPETSRPVKLIGHTEIGPATWYEHEVASFRATTLPRPPRIVWDCSLQLNVPEPTTPPGTFVGRPVASMSFARYKELFYPPFPDGIDRTVILTIGRREII